MGYVFRPVLLQWMCIRLAYFVYPYVTCCIKGPSKKGDKKYGKPPQWFMDSPPVLEYVFFFLLSIYPLAVFTEPVNIKPIDKSTSASTHQQLYMYTPNEAPSEIYALLFNRPILFDLSPLAASSMTLSPRSLFNPKNLPLCRRFLWELLLFFKKGKDFDTLRGRLHLFLE